MANVNSPFGLRPVNLDGSACDSFAVGTYAFPSSDSTAMFIGDPVNLAGSADSVGNPTVVKTTMAGSNYSIGAIVDFLPDTSESPVYRAASTTRIARVANDPMQVFAIQCDESLAVTDIGNTASLVNGTGSTASGLSGVQLDSSTIGSGTQLVIVGILRNANNELGTNCVALVRFNLHQARNTTGV